MDPIHERSIALGIGVATGALLVVVASRRADDTPTGVAPKQRVRSSVPPGRQRYRCETCGVEMDPGNLARHHGRAGHSGRVEV